MQVDIDLFDNSIVQHFMVDISTKNAYGSAASVSCIWVNKRGKGKARFTEATGFNCFGYSDKNTLTDVLTLLELI